MVLLKISGVKTCVVLSIKTESVEVVDAQVACLNQMLETLVLIQSSWHLFLCFLLQTNEFWLTQLARFAFHKQYLCTVCENMLLLTSDSSHFFFSMAWPLSCTLHIRAKQICANCCCSTERTSTATSMNTATPRSCLPGYQVWINTFKTFYLPCIVFEIIKNIIG